MTSVQETARGALGDHVPGDDGRPSPVRATPRRLGESTRRLTLLVLLYAIPAVLVVRPVIDNDIWWHLRTGQWIVEHRQLPVTDPFSLYGQGRPWMAYSWLYDLLVYGLHEWLGLTGILLLRIALTLAVAVAVHRLVLRRDPMFVRSTGLVTLAFVGLAPLLSERSWLFTILFSALTLDAVLDLRAGTRSRAHRWLPLWYALWANLHIQFINGLFLLGLACASPVIEKMLGRGRRTVHADTAGSRGWWELVALTVACTAATLLNPYHVRLYAQVAAFASQTGVLSILNELLAMSFRWLPDWAVLALTCGAAFALGRKNDLSAFDVLLLASTTYFAFRSRRDCWFVVLAALAILAAAGRKPVMMADRFPITRSRALLVAAGVASVLASMAAVQDLTAARLTGSVADAYPVKAAAVVERRGDRGPLYNSYEWGGYLIWRLPNLPVAIDGRANLHGDSRIERSLKTWGGLPGWDTDPELAAANLVIAARETALFSLLCRDRRFELVHQDKIAAVFVARQTRQSGGIHK